MRPLKPTVMQRNQGANMCKIDWMLVASMLGGVGAFLTGIAALFILPKQLGYKKKSEKSKEELDDYKLSNQLMISIYKQYMSSQEGIVWQRYPGQDSQKIVDRISQKTNIEPDQIKAMLDKLNEKGSI